MSANNVNVQPANATQTPVVAATATIKSRPNIMPANYMYTSSSGLLNRPGGGGSGENNKPTPPPTLPKYTSSFNAGGGFRDRDKDSLGGSYRLAGLDRLGLRQKYLDQSGGGGGSPTNGGAAPQTNGGGGGGGSSDSPPAPPQSTHNSQSKREMFFSATETSSLKEANKARPPEPPAAARSPPEIAKEEAGKEMKETEMIVREKPKLKELDGYVGFANLPNQVYRKAVKKGFEFNLMVVGESGLGKSTLINSMFLTDIYNAAEHPGPTQRLKKTVAVEWTKLMLKENGVNIMLTVVDTPGFGDAVDNSNCWTPVIEYIESKYEDYLNSEARVTRKQEPDQRVHCCLYFIQPSGHGLKSLDIEFMKRLCDKVNIIPIIAKADTLTADECALFKRQILNEIAQHKIKIYEFPDTLDDDDEHKLNRALRDRVPFAVVGSNTVIEIDGKKLRGRKYPWGLAEVENLEHCDFIALRNMVIRTHLQDLKDVTNNVHYENYRCRKLAGLGGETKPARISNKNPLAQMDEEKREHDLKMKKMEAEMEQVFEMKVREKKQKLKDSEMELTRRHESTRKSLEQQAKELDEERRQFEIERQRWEQENNITLEELRRRSLESSREAIDGKKEKKKKGLF